MTRKIDRLDVLALGLLGGAAAITAALYSALPARVPTHFDAHGIATAWMDRPIGAWILPVIGLATWGLVRFAPVVLPGAWRARIAGSPLVVTAFVFAAFTSALQVLVLYAATHPGEAIGRPLVLAIATMWIALGQLMPRLRRNPIIGVRTPWTLTSDENWLRTHRVAAYTFGIGGVVAVVADLAFGASGSPFAIGAIIASALAPAVYSYFLARRLPPSSLGT